MSTRSADGEFRAGWPVVVAAMLGIGLGLSPVPFYTTGIFAPVLARQFGWSFADIFAGFPILTAIVLFMSPAVGWLSDRYGVRRIAIASSALFGLCYMSQALMTGSLALYYGIWSVMAVVGAGTLPVTWTRAVNNRFQARKGLALGLTLLGTGLFGFACKSYTTALIAHFGWRGAYVGIGLLPLLLALPVALGAFYDVGEGESRQERKARAAELAANTPGLTLRQALRDVRFWIMGIAFLPISFAVGGPIPNLENILHTAGFRGGEIVSLTQWVGLSVILGRVAGGWLIDRVWAPAVAFVLLAASALACTVLARGGFGYERAALSIAAIGCSAGLEYDLMAFLVARYLGMKSYGSIYGTLYGFFALGAGVGPLVYGAIFDRSHSYGGILLASAALFLLGAILLLALGPYRRFSEVGPAHPAAGAPATNARN
ncbi:MAG TPA: MFS transporter [Steroidobacteraceae bacterium]|nr:MFS transporter [Steroidobacteraceae bacterium]